MRTLTVQGEVTAEGVLKVEVPWDLPPGAVEVVLTVRSLSDGSGKPGPKWDQLYGSGREVWQGIDPVEYLRDLRQDREPPP